MAVALKNQLHPSVNLRVLRWALVGSLLLHLLAYGGWKLAKRNHWLENSLLARIMRRAENAVLPKLNPKAFTRPPDSPQMMLNFAYVDPSQAAAKPPEKAKYIAAVDSVAANPTMTRNSEHPQVDGAQEKVVRTTESQATRLKPKTAVQVPKETPDKAEPNEIKNPSDQKERKEQRNPLRYHEVGNLAMAKPRPETDPTEKATTEEEPVHHVRPRRLADASPSVRGERMKQNGGVARTALESSLDAKGSIVGNYENDFIAAVQKHWDDLLGDRGAEHAGKVVLDFVLHYNGRVTDMKVVENNVGDYQCALCQRAILDPAPFNEWPAEMRHELKSDDWHLRFTFWYENR